MVVVAVVEEEEEGDDDDATAWTDFFPYYLEVIPPPITINAQESSTKVQEPGVYFDDDGENHDQVVS